MKNTKIDVYVSRIYLDFIDYFMKFYFVESIGLVTFRFVINILLETLIFPFEILIQGLCLCYSLFIIIKI